MNPDTTASPDTHAQPDAVGQHDRPATPCRLCATPLQHTFVDLGHTPLCESFLTAEQLDQPETHYPLHAYVCHHCWLVQLKEYVSGHDIFGGDYAYFSSFSDSWLQHCQRYTDTIIDRLKLGRDSKVMELASNDGYLLQYFVQRGIPALGIEPAKNCAAAARQRGVDTRVAFFGQDLARQLVEEQQQPDLLTANNVLAHVPDLNDFVAGIKTVLHSAGTLTVEFPHLLTLIDGNQFDTIYHEHFCYYSFTTANTLFAAHGLRVYDVEELPTHGGSLRLYVAHDNAPHAQPAPTVRAMLDREQQRGITDPATYRDFAARVHRVKHDLLGFLLQAKRDGKRVAGYGAPGKGNTLLNCCGIGPDLLPYTVDRNPYKHGRFTPGSHLPIYAPDMIDRDRPDYVLILPWNLREEIAGQLAHIQDWGGRCVVPLPTLEVLG